MKKIVYFVIIAIAMVTFATGCKKDPTKPKTPVGVSVGVNNNGIFISFSVGYPGGYSGGYYYPNGYPSYSSSDFYFVGYLANPVIGPGSRPIMDQNGAPLIGPNGSAVVANVFPNVIQYSQTIPLTTVRFPVMVGQHLDVTRQVYYDVK